MAGEMRNARNAPPQALNPKLETPTVPTSIKRFGLGSSTIQFSNFGGLQPTLPVQQYLQVPAIRVLEVRILRMTRGVHSGPFV